jgi:PTS system nitrogen regulatory IIA component
MRISLERAAIMLGTSEQMLRRWVEQGAISSIEKEGEYEFDLKSLESWAEKRRMTIKTAPAPSPSQGQRASISLHDAMQLGGIHFGIGGNDINGVLSAALTQSVLPPSVTKEDLLEPLIERERLASTGIGNGVAIPHPRHPIEGIPQGGMVSTFFLEQEIDFNAIDGAPVFVLFLMLSPHTKCHLQLLSQLSFCLHEPSFVAHLRTCDSKGSLLNQVKKIEKNMKRTPRTSG